MISNSKKDFLFELIKNLSPAEKRSFKLFAKRMEANENAKFVQLFDVLDKMSHYDEGALLKKLPVAKKQLANLKSHLYKQLLVSLRLIYADRNVELHLNEQIDFARILYSKGLYMQSLKVLEKAKQLATRYFLDTLVLRIVELEKVIESQHITRSMQDRAETLSQQATDMSVQISRKNAFSNLSLQLYGLYLKTGYVKDAEDRKRVEAFYAANMPQFEIQELGFYEKLYLYQAQVWFFHIVQDFPLCYRAAQRWVDLFDEFPDMRKVATGNYLKAYHYLLDTLFYLGYYERFTEVLQKFEDNLRTPDFQLDENGSVLAFLYYYTNALNIRFMRGEFSLGIEAIMPTFKKEFQALQNKLDVHHQAVLNYKVACLYFGAGENPEAIFYLDEVIKQTGAGLSEDLQCFAHILKLIASYEAGMDEDLDQQIRNVYKVLVKMNDLHQVQREMMAFIRQLGQIYDYQLKAAFVALRERLKPFEQHPYEKRAFLYLDIISWLESKIENRSVQEIIQEKFREKMEVEK
ncbi:MAG: hypothetical protein JJU34_04085 [Lunatimonas sp.]|uniref:hypothetical protein n=1 Tax=Lunatimonas sp. TaxID=2060141 RepID=UPI00263B2853|nr:hypothetical protein [Lunatimonas sp.]MCC5936437.1 hypothetical protein [Lunatimonas sp.]